MLDYQTENLYLIIGAGPVGLAYAKALKTAGLPYQQIEADNDIGGNWYHGVYDTAHIISPKKVMEYSDYPMPDDYPDFPSRQNMLDYYLDYTKTHDLRRAILFNKKVIYLDPIKGNKWKAYFADGEERVYKGVLLCNGHHWDKRMPKFEGDFEGEILHAKDYKTPDQLRGKKIVVIGAGNSACDLASEAARVGKKAFISIRSSAWFLPKTVMGQPLSAFSKPWVPDWIQRLGLKIGLKIIIGDLKHYGLPTPDHKIFEKHPTIGTELLHYIKHGKVKPKPHIAKLSGKYVHFTDGSVEEIDMIVAATGYHLSYPFLPKELQRVKGVVAQVYGDSMFEDIKGLYLIGWQQARGGVGALAPAGGGLITRYLRLQEEISVPLGGVLKALGEEIPKTHLIGMFQILKNIKHAHKTFSSLRKKALKMAEENPNFENPSFPLPSNLSKDLTVY